MKLIDEKGRICGKFNIIDVILGVIIVAMLFGVGYKLFIQKDTDVNEQAVKTKTVEVTFLVEKVPTALKNNVKEGDKIILNNQITDAEVVNLDSSASKTTTYDDQGDLKVVDNPLMNDLKITARLDAEISDVSVVFMDETLKTNMDFVLETKSFYANSKIIDIVLAD